MLGRLLLIAVTGVVAVALTSALAAPAANDASRLVIRTGPGLKMKLTRAGTEVDYLRPGKHRITIRDTSRSHSVQIARLGFQAFPGTTLSTLRFVGTKTVTVTLKEGNYSISCRRHYYRGMNDSFVVQ